MSRIESVTTEAADGLRRLATGLMRLMKAAVQPLIDAQRRAAERRELQSLDDATLHDIGLTRAELTSYLAEQHGRAEPTRVRAMCAVQSNGVACAP